ncbi:hypothetical protein FHH43_01390 [Clostridium perfringens]|nr:hypothetical protein [Clostridium perfringens]
MVDMMEDKFRDKLEKLGSDISKVGVVAGSSILANACKAAMEYEEQIYKEKRFLEGKKNG